MMPSRGMQRAQRDAPRLFQLQCRNLSSATRRIPQTSVYLRKNPSPISKGQQWQAVAPSIGAVRHASSWWPFGKSEPPVAPVESTLEPATTQAPPTEASTASVTSADSALPPPVETVQPAAIPLPDSTPSELPNIDTITIDTPEIVAIPDTIGYLHALGIDYGWGPSSMLQWTIEHLHVWGGLPWWGAIAATSVLLRIVLLPMYFKSSDVMARQQALTSVTKPISDRMTEARKIGDNTELRNAWAQLRTVRKQAGISFSAQFAPMIVQGVFGYCGLKLLRAAAAIPVPAFKSEGFLWLQDLTVPDPYLILPVLMGGVIHLLVRFGGETGAAPANNPMMPQIRNFMLYGMPFVICLGTGWLPGAVVVWFAAGGLLGVAQAQILRQAKVREFVGISQMYKPSAGQEDLGPMHALMERWSAKTKKNTIDVKGTVKESTHGTAAAGRTASKGMGKNEVFMRPTYQQPNLRFTSPTRGASSSSPHEVFESNSPPASVPGNEMIPPSGKVPQPTAPGGADGVLNRASQAWKKSREQAVKRATDYVEKQNEGSGDVEAKMQKRGEEIFKRRSEEYDKRKQAKKAEEGTKATKGRKGGR